jgi:acetyl-CoA C-acetyltransferase
MAMRDVARRAHLGVPPSAYAAAAGPTYAAMSGVAAENTYAWNRTQHTAADIVDPSPVNFLVESYYTKYMVACPDVDQAGALLVAAAEVADDLGIPQDRRVHLRAWCTAEDPPHVAANPHLWRSPAMAAASAHTFELAGTTIDDVALMDLYSCFPVAINFNRDALGLAADDMRPVTVTGGLPYAGAAASSYVVMSIAAMVERLRADPGAWGLVNGLGMQLASHSYALYCTEPGPVRPPAQDRVQHVLDREATVPITVDPGASGRLATFSTAYLRDGSPRDTVAVCDLDGGRRCYARATDPAVVAALASGEHVGRTVTLRPAGDGSTALVDVST